MNPVDSIDQVTKLRLEKVALEKQLNEAKEEARKWRGLVLQGIWFAISNALGFVLGAYVQLCMFMLKTFPMIYK